jgi:hypothetical protein
MTQTPDTTSEADTDDDFHPATMADDTIYMGPRKYVAADRIEELEAKLKWVLEERDTTFALMLKRLESAEAKLDKTLDWLSKVRQYAISWDDRYLVERSDDILAELKGENQ